MRGDYLNIEMGDYQDRAKRYGVEVSFIQALQLLRIEVPTASGVDVGFSTSAASFLGSLFSGFRRHQIAPRLFVYGKNADSVAYMLCGRERLIYLLTFVLDNYAYSIELSKSLLITRVNLMEGSPKRDGTGGVRLFSALSEIAGELRSSGVASFMPVVPTGSQLGPAKFRTIGIICAGLSPLLAVVVLFAWAIHHSPSLLHR